MPGGVTAAGGFVERVNAHDMKQALPSKPDDIDPLAAALLERLRKYPESAEVVLGGHFALKHYVSSRATHDVDAWWRSEAKPEAIGIFKAEMRKLAADHELTYHEREFGETVSLEVARAGKTIFSFQISVRSVELERPLESPWPPIAIESLADNIGAKMNALVNRGLPRDFVDVRTIVSEGLATTKECWELWRAKNPTGFEAMARSQVQRHLERIERARPLPSIDDGEERELARATRSFFRGSFLGLGHGHGR